MSNFIYLFSHLQKKQLRQAFSTMRMNDKGKVENLVLTRMSHDLSIHTVKQLVFNAFKQQFLLEKFATKKLLLKTFQNLKKDKIKNGRIRLHAKLMTRRQEKREKILKTKIFQILKISNVIFIFQQ